MKVFDDGYFERRYGLFVDGEGEGGGRGGQEGAGEGAGEGQEGGQQEAAGKGGERAAQIGGAKKEGEGQAADWRVAITDEDEKKYAESSTAINHHAQHADAPHKQPTNAITPGTATHQLGQET